jgi:hypothetical protein
MNAPRASPDDKKFTLLISPHVLHLADFQWNQYDVPAFRGHGATNQYLQQDPSEERTSGKSEGVVREMHRFLYG